LRLKGNPSRVCYFITVYRYHYQCCF